MCASVAGASDEVRLPLTAGEIDESFKLLNQSAQGVFTRLHQEVLNEATTGGAPTLLCMLASLSRMTR
eukprot:CAMPEP_0170315538 /NCGR_PEP_ID=MMETSP0116_2-20130129/58372_1 /TAXON_ID=400756 /ORGANISM="Durinskia baltica, Strain CSIRO CS-38" /LENGTH=67 /DNA_ID=CAMNT_0010568047 /DNA_START=1 /DNA_END=200 /DNA_ORIENTATION=+